ncbi:histidinol-phosphate transaminase [Alkalilimnicola sp. S0819]|uniref:histidinol-phosphate transaminase n=1 Tax=Alkalilimnicola sp. S0819 TaxID=2613922 RepID=UPI001D00BC3B|nr:histidinol-phosphate transaminase [Alkalilimnicola sp. S0819]
MSFCDLAVPGVQALQPYQPGKPMSELARELGLRPEQIVKLASNENPLGPSPKALAAAREALAESHRYPDGNAFELRAALAEHHGVEPGQITLGSGSNDVLELVARAFLRTGLKCVFSQHAFAVYPIATQAVGAEAVVVPALGADSDSPAGHDLEAMADAVDADTRVVFIANPNNPTGTWVGAEAVERFLARMPAHVIVVLDEAYVEYAARAPGYREGSYLLARHPNLIITRTFSKAYGLGGLRVGYGLSDPQVADLLNRVRMPFNVNNVAQAAATAALDDREHLRRSVELNGREMQRLGQALAGMGLSSLPSAANFLCTRVGPRAEEVNQGLLRQGVIVRPVGGGYQLPEYLRFSIGTEAENDRLLQALAVLRDEGLLGAD